MYLMFFRVKTAGFPYDYAKDDRFAYKEIGHVSPYAKAAWIGIRLCV